MSGHADFQSRAHCSCTNGTSTGECADRLVLAALLAGQLSSDEHARVEAHVSHCPCCQDRLRELDESPAKAGTDEFLDVLRSVAAEYQTGEASALRVAVERLKAGRAGREPSQTSTRQNVDELINETIGDYRIVREVGHGGMGIVYEAEQLSLRRRVALKTLPFASLLDARRLARFQNEARMAAQLEHPHIVPVYAVGIERGIHYYAMRYVDGQNLAQVLASIRHRCGSFAEPARAREAIGGASTVGVQQDATDLKRRPMSPQITEATIADTEYLRTVVQLTITAAEAVDYAHSQGVVHRDIKPSNLMLDSSGHLWVADFGLARIATEGSLSTSGALLGTVPYMSPEQASAGGGVVDHRSDVYSLGATLYELVTLVTPFGDGPLPKLLSRIATDEPPPPRRHNPRIPRDLETIILKSLAKEPAERYPTAQALADDLCRFMGEQPIRASRPRIADRVARVVRKHPSAIAATGFVLLLLSGLSGLLALSVSERDQFTTKLKASLNRQQELNQQLRDSVSETQKYAASVQEQVYGADLQSAAAAYAKRDLASVMDLLSRQRPRPGGKDLRGVEWYWLQNRIQADGGTIDVSSQPLYSSHISPNNRLFATAGADSILRLFNPETWQLIREWPTAQLEINDIAFSGDSGQIASTGDDGTLCLWEVATGKQLFRVNAYTKYAREVLFANDSRELITSGSDQQEKLVRVWDAAEGTRVRELRGQWGRIASLAISADERVISVGTFNSIHLIDARDGTALRRLDGHSGAVFALLFVPGESLLISGGDDTTVRLWNLDDGTQRVIGRHQDSIHSLALLPDGRHVASGDRNGVIRIWDLRDPRMAELDLQQADVQPIVEWPIGPEGQARWCDMTSDGQTIIVATDAQLRARDVAKGMETVIPLADPSVVYHKPADPTASQLGDISADGHLLVLANLVYRNDSGYASGWKLQTRIPRSADSIYSVQFSPDASRLALGNQLGRVWIHDPLTGESLATLVDPSPIPDGHNLQSDDWVSAMTFSPDGRWLAAESGPTTRSRINVWDVESGVLLFSPRSNEHLPHVKSLAFCPDQERLVSCALDMKIRFWSASSQDQIEEWPVYNPSVGLDAVAVSPDARWLATSDLSPNPNLRLWEMRSKKVVWFDNRKYGRVKFSADSRRLLAGGYGAVVRLWDVDQIVADRDSDRPQIETDRPSTSTTSWREVSLAHEGRVYDLTVTPDGTCLISTGADGRLRINARRRESTESPRLIAEPGAVIHGMTTDPQGNIVLWEQEKAAWLIRSGHSTGELLPSPAPPLQGAAIDPQNGEIFIMNRKGQVHVTSCSNQAAPRAFQIPLNEGEEIRWGALIPGIGALAVLVRTSDADAVRIVELDTGTLLGELRPSEMSRLTVAMNESSLVIAGSRTLSRMRLRDRQTDSLPGHSEGITAMAICSACPMAATAGGERNIRLWDLEPLAPRAPMPGHYSRIRAIAFSIDGRTLASADDDGVIKLWQVATGRHLFELPERLPQCDQLMFVSHPGRLVCRCRDGGVVLFRFPTSE